MRIGIDARFWGPLGKGLGRYTQKLIESLEKISAENGHRYFIFLRKENFDEYNPTNPNFKKVLADYQWYTFSEQVNMLRLLNKFKLDLVHFPHFNFPINYRGKFVVTVHDLILLRFPTVRASTLSPFFYKLKYLAYKFVIKKAFKKSKKIITVSEFTKKDILANYPQINPNKIAVTYEAVDNFPKSELGNGAILNKYAIIKPYLLYVGNAYPHKNLETLVEVFDDIARDKKYEDLNLVLVGKKDFFYEKLIEFARRKNSRNIIFTGLVEDKDLGDVYQGALAFVFPSRYEGFGLPPLEAMKFGVPVAASKTSSIPEVLGESALYFDPIDKESIKQAIIRVISDDNIRKELISLGAEQAAKYSWRKLAQKTLEIYESV